MERVLHVLQAIAKLGDTIAKLGDTIAKLGDTKESLTEHEQAHAILSNAFEEIEQDHDSAIITASSSKQVFMEDFEEELEFLATDLASQSEELIELAVGYRSEVIHLIKLIRTKSL